MKVRGIRSSTAVGAAAAVAVAAITAGCATLGTGSAAAGPPEKQSIVVDVSPTIDSAGLYIAQMDGLFRQQGLNVTITFAPASQLAVTSLMNGTSDVASTDYVTYLENELQGHAHLRVIAEASALEPNDFAIYVAPHSQIRNIAELEGQTIGVTAPDDIATLLVRALLADNGVPETSVNIQFGFQLLNVAQQLDGGQADAAPLPEPFASEGEQQYGLQELADVDQGVTTNFPIQGYAVTQAWAQKYPNTLAAFDRALEEGQEIADTNRGAVEAAIEKYLGISPRTAAVITLPEYPLSVSPTQLQRVVDAMVQFGMLPAHDMTFKITDMLG